MAAARLSHSGRKSLEFQLQRSIGGERISGLLTKSFSAGRSTFSGQSYIILLTDQRTGESALAMGDNDHVLGL
jgi:uncharacterized protein with von Willebrand factor type A (vWA) domain